MLEQAIWKAHSHFETILPDWLSVDLIALASVSPRICDRILQTLPMPDNLYLALKARIED